jgi:methionyl-tRNA formyltransferase
MTDKFDAGPILAQEKLPITTDDTRLTLYDKLFHLGSDLLVRTLPNLSPNPSPESGEGDLPASRQEPRGEVFYARQITRQDGFALWDEYQLQKNDPKSQLFTKYRAFAGWPGVWTLDPSGNRIIFRLHHP